MNYPNAKRQVARWQQKVDEIKEMQEEQQLMQDLTNEQVVPTEAMQEGAENEMPM